MGQRGEIFTLKRFVEDGGLTYFFNVKENRYGDLFLNLVESRKKDDKFVRFSLIVYSEDFKKFNEILENAVTKLKTSTPEWEEELKTGSGRRKYRFTIKSAKNRELYLIISESRVGSDENYENVSVRVFKKNLDIFLEGYDRAASHMKTS
ncbi:MAG: DUF3276 family protein [Spirochaetales bacterium]|nr:DUF3276 family protein [Spirochaetales bacterium]